MFFPMPEYSIKIQKIIGCATDFPLISTPISYLSDIGINDYKA